MKEERPMKIRGFAFDDRQLTVTWSDGSQSRYPALWLRDNCPEDRDPGTGQRLVDIAELPEEPLLEAVHQEGDETLTVTWAGEKKQSRFDLRWLHDYRLDRSAVAAQPRTVPWRADQADALCWADYPEVVASETVCRRWLRALAEHGIAFLRRVPREEGAVLEVAGRFGYVRETNYGKLFDVRSVPNPEHLAYTNLALRLHTDNPYRDPTPGIQLLHCLQAGEEGGESTFLDGFAAAALLREGAPEAFAVLTRTPVRFAYRSTDTQLSAEKPLIQLDLRGELDGIHYNNRMIAPLQLPPDALSAFYAAYRRFARLLQDPALLYRVGLQNGDLVAFDNRRILHGREAFTVGDRPRHLQGCYMDKDGLLSRLAVLERAAQR
jgi:gamma-butyrobetaine dioxygenase